MITNPLILNRDSAGVFKKPSDGWYQIAPLGEFNHPSGIVQVLDSQAAESIVNRFNQEASQPNCAGLLVDFDHFSYDTTQSSQAAGWITELQNRDTGVWAKIRWTATGDQAISNGEFRLISPTWKRSDMEPLDKEGKRARPKRLDSAGLTNNPQIKGMAPLSNRQGEEPPTQTQKKENKMKSVLSALGLAEDASETSALNATNALLNRATKAESELSTLKTASAEQLKAATDAQTPLTNRVKELETANAALTAVVVESDLARFSDRIKPEARDTWKAQLIANRVGTLALLDSIAVVPQKDANGKTVLNRDTTKTPPSGATPTFTEIVANRMAADAKLVKSQAVSQVIQSNPTEYQAWLTAGGGAL